MSFRLAAYAVCVEDGRVLLTRWVPPTGDPTWTLPGGRVDHGEDPFDAVLREVAEETGGGLRPEPDGDTAGSAWTAVPEVAALCRSSLVDVGLGLARTLHRQPATSRRLRSAA